MGAHVHRFAVGQRPELTAIKPRAGQIDDAGATDPSIRIVILALLAVDGVLSAVAGALLLPSYIGSVPFPISAFISGLLNAALVWAAGRWTTSTRLAALPLWTWLLAVGAMALPGPGGDIIFGGRGVMAYSPLLLLAAGAAAAVVGAVAAPSQKLTSHTTRHFFAEGGQGPATALLDATVAHMARVGVADGFARMKSGWTGVTQTCH